MEEVALHGAFILIVDAVLCLTVWAGPVPLQRSSRGGLVGVWAIGAVKWLILHVFASTLTEGKRQPVLGRLVAHLCLLSPVFESGRIFLSPPSDSCVGLGPDCGMLLLRLMSSCLACVVWEIGLCFDGKMKKGNGELNARHLLIRMLQFFKPDTLYVIAAFSALILAVTCDTFIPMYEGKVIDVLTGQAFNSSFSYAIGKLALLTLGSALFSGLRGGTFKFILLRLNRRLKHLLFQTLLQQEVNFFDKNKPGYLSSRLHNDVEKMGLAVSLNANAVVRSTVRMCLMLAVMLHLSWELTLLTCFEMLLLAILQNRYIALSRELKEQIKDCEAQNKDLTSQVIKWICTIRSFNAEKEEVRRHNETLDRMCSVRRRSGIYSVIFQFIRKLVSLGIKLLMLFQARRLLSSGHLTIGSLVSFLLYQRPMSRNLREICFSYGEIMSTVGVIAKVFTYLDRTPECKPEGDLAPEELEGRIVFQNVTFSYPSAPSDKPALKSVSMEFQPGKMTALVGPSGSGKTSCVSLLKRLYEPQEGQILLDGKPLHHYKQKYLHQKMASVSQSPELFSASLRHNIEYGLKDCSIEKVKRAAKKVNADDFIAELDNEHDTEMEECGDKHARGRQHVIAVIRALVRDPRVIVLDETSGKLDVEVWHAVLQEVLSSGQTVIVVAHKLKTVEKAHRIILIENGEVVEEGTHQELLTKRGRYHQFSQNPQ
ncbi:antigen peptide transporter 2 [Brachionichthys hirsutus]|uniref:antigen peptide transporter 2 n=1 Tax=Brachionichthys hirsutus TaxID=412623 RepID=UPI003604C8FF